MGQIVAVVFPYFAMKLGNFLHFQCMQSMLPNMLENQRFLPSASNLAMSSLFGDLKYYSEKIEITA
jgi:hypothetical protein